MNFRLAYEYSKEQQRRARKKQIIFYVIIVTLALVLALLEGSLGHAKNDTIQTGTHGSVEAGSSRTGSGSTEVTGPIRAEATVYRRDYIKVGTGEATNEAFIYADTEATEGATIVEDGNSGATGSTDTGYTSLGVFRITAYCACKECCGKSEDDPAYGITYSGTQVTEGWTVAADPAVLPMGSMVSIDDHIYRVEDIGAAVTGNTIDIYMGSHESALDFGVHEVEVFILEGGTE